jgi:hypothetical protein
MKRLGNLVFLSIWTLLALTGCAQPQKTANAPLSSIEAPSKYAPVIDPANFVNTVDNPYFPLKLGTVFIYEGKTEKGNEYNEMTVTSETKVILGVTCVVIADKVMVDGKLEEATLDWYAQDKQGNVWYFGEDSKTYDANGNVVDTKGSWEAGVKKAKPGIIMEASPKVGDTYRQEYYKGEAEDMASVQSLNESTTVKFGSYSGLLMTKEWSALEPTVVEQKYYAKGIGFILVTAGDTERLELIEIRQP